MSGITAVGGVGAGLSQAEFRVEYQARALKEQQNVTQDLGYAAVRLIQAAMSAVGSAENDLDVRA